MPSSAHHTVTPASAVRGAVELPLPPLLPLLPLAGTLAPSLMFPAMFRFGATKGRAVYITVVIGMAAACAALMVTGDTTERAWPLPLTLGIALAVFAASWALSVRWFEAREL